VSVPAHAPRELFVREVRREGRSVVVLRAIDYGDSCVVETEVSPVVPGASPLAPGPYSFPDARGASGFVTDVTEALMYLGCEVAAD
jgi:hypothetical protein